MSPLLPAGSLSRVLVQCNTRTAQRHAGTAHGAAASTPATSTTRHICTHTHRSNNQPRKWHGSAPLHSPKSGSIPSALVFTTHSQSYAKPTARKEWDGESMAQLRECTRLRAARTTSVYPGGAQYTIACLTLAPAHAHTQRKMKVQVRAAPSLRRRLCFCYGRCSRWKTTAWMVWVEWWGANRKACVRSARVPCLLALLCVHAGASHRLSAGHRPVFVFCCCTHGNMLLREGMRTRPR